MSRLEWPEKSGFPRGALPNGMAPLQSVDLPWDVVAGGAVVRNYAVVMLFIPPLQPGEAARIVFTRRSTTVRSHKGQIGFAGGKAESEDVTPRVTALRELSEELGVPPETVTVVGLLPSVKALDGGEVRPIVGLATVDVAQFVPEPAEVDIVFAEPWTYFADGKAEEFRFNIFGNWRTSRVYHSPGGRVWGLTAEILRASALR